MRKNTFNQANKELAISVEQSFVVSNNRTIFFTGVVEEQSGIGIVSELLRIEEEDNMQEATVKGFKREPIVLVINSCGGNVIDFWAMIDTIENLKTPVYTVCLGMCASAGAKLFMVGKKRYIGQHAQILLHQISYGAYGSHESIKEAVIQGQLDDQAITDYITSHSKVTQEEMDDVYARKTDWILSAEEAIEKGIADEIYKGMHRIK